MNRVKTILAGVDFSDGSKTALEQAVRLARTHRATLHVIHVVDALAVRELAEVLKIPIKQERQTVVIEARRELTRWLGDTEPARDFHAEVIIGTPLDEILKRVRELAADLVVLGVHGSNATGYGAGMLATKVLRKAQTKVLLVAASHRRPFKTIVACVDFSPTAREVVEQAKRVAVQDESRVYFLHVFFGPWHRLHYRAPTPEASPDFQQQYRGVLQRQLDEFSGGNKGIESQCILLEAPGYGQGIAQYARNIDADLIVIGTKGQTNLRYLLLGSTAERLLRELPCSLLAVKPAAP